MDMGEVGVLISTIIHLMDMLVPVYMRTIIAFFICLTTITTTGTLVDLYVLLMDVSLLPFAVHPFVLLLRVPPVHLAVPTTAVDVHLVVPTTVAEGVKDWYTHNNSCWADKDWRDCKGAPWYRESGNSHSPLIKIH